MSKDELLVLEMLLKIRDKRVEFATKHHRNTSGEPMDFTTNPHLVQLYNTLSRRLVLQGSAQSMKSEMLVIDTLAMAACGLSIFFVLPKDDARNSYVQNRINKRVLESPEYRRLMSSGDFDNNIMKNFGSGVIKFVGSNVLTDFKEFSADAMIIEEVDQCNKENLRYGLDRLRGHRYQFQRVVGNPTGRGVGINEWFRRSNQNVWHIPCDKCGEPQELDWFKTVIGQKFDDDGVATDYWILDSDWTLGCGRDIRPMCPKCATPLNRFSKHGVWISQNPQSDIEGYLMTMLINKFNSITEMFEIFELAWHDTGLDHFYNSCLGIPFVSETSKLTINLLRKSAYRHEPYRFVIKDYGGHVENDSSAGPCSMGIDVGKKFDIRISEVLPDGVRRAVYIGKAESRDELVSLGLRYNVKVAVMDSMPEWRVVEDFMTDAPFPVWACRYDSEGSDKRLRKDKKMRMLLVDRTTLLDKGLLQFKLGKNLIPDNFSSILKGQYVEEMTFPVRQEEVDKGGNIRYIWTHGKDHQRHTDGYDLLAAQMLQAASGLQGAFVG